MAKARKSAARGLRGVSQGEMLEAVHQIWLAGIGAVAAARKEGPKRFEKLLDDGARISESARRLADNAVRNTLEQVQAAVGSRVKQAQSQANEAVDNFEKIFQTRVHRALHRIGVPSADEITALSRRVQALSNSVDKLAARTSSARSKARKGAKRR